MSTKVYYAYRCRLVNMTRAMEWLRISMWKRVVKLANDENVSTFADAERFTKDHAEAGFHVWIDEQTDRETHVLFCLFGLPRFCELGRPPTWLHEFAFWNNSDMPDGMSAADWKRRGDTWDRVALDDGRWDARLTNIVFQNGAFGQSAVALECVESYRKSWLGKRTLLSKMPLPK
jgi:hypothetical protein